MSGGQKEDTSMLWVMIILVAVIIAYFLYMRYSHNHIYIWYYIKFPMVYVSSTLGEAINPLFFWLNNNWFVGSGEMVGKKYENLHDFMAITHEIWKLGPEEMSKRVPRCVQWSLVFCDKVDEGDIDVSKIGLITSYMYLPFVAPFIIYYAIKSTSKNFFNENLDMEALALQESELWPALKPVLGLSKKDINNLFDGPWRVSASAEKWLFDEDYINYFNRSGDEAVVKKGKLMVSKRKSTNLKTLEDLPDGFRFSLNMGKLNKLLLEELGEKWNGVSGLTDDEKHLFCALILKASRKPKEAQAFADLLGRAYSTIPGLVHKKETKDAKNKLRKETEKTLKAYGDSRIVRELGMKHFYKIGVFSGLMERAWDDGVFASALFVWLKPVNRRLYYMINSLGRRVPHFEAVASWSHYNYEKSLGVICPTPQLKEAINGLDDFFYDRYYSYMRIHEVDDIINQMKNDNDDD